MNADARIERGKIISVERKGGNKVENKVRITFPSTIKLMENGNRVIVFNRLNGQWLKLSTECYELLLVAAQKAMTKETFLQCLYDDEDREYFSEMLDILFERKIIGSDEPRKIKDISFAVTDRCNLACKHCIVDAGVMGDAEQMDLLQIKDIIRKIKQVNPATIVITGGEPLVRSDWREILEYTRENYAGNVDLMTNATLITEENVENIITNVDSISISIDGVDENSCSKIRGKGVFKKVISAIEILHRHGFYSIGLSMVLTPQNARYYREFMALNNKYETKPQPRALSLAGRAKDNKEMLLEDMKFETGIEKEDVQYNGFNIYHPTCSCTAGYDQLVIEANGEIYPCNLFCEKKYCLGNINNIECLESIFQQTKEILHPLLNEYEPDNYEKCRSCNVRYLCWNCLEQIRNLEDSDEFEVRCKRNKEQYMKIWE